MLPPPYGRSVSVSMALIALLGAANAQGQAQPNQVLDQVDAFNSGAVLEMAFDRPSLPDATKLPITGSELAACKLTASGLYCLERDDDGRQVVRQWQEPLNPAFVDRFQCDDTALGLQNGICTGLTVDLSGAIWVAGRKATSTTSYSLVKVVSKASLIGACSTSSGWTELSAGLPAPLCAREFATDIGLLSDLDAIDGEVADLSRWPLGPGILALRDGAAAIYFNLNVPGITPTDFAGWGVQPPERLLSTTLLQVPQPVAPNNAAVFSNYILAATNSGRILSKAAPTPGAPQQVFDASPQPLITIDQNTWGACIGSPSCNIGGATLTAAYPKKIGEKSVTPNGPRGLGVVGGSAGNEIDKGERLDVQLPPGYTVTALQILFLYNGPEFGDNTEQASITTTDQATNATITYTLTASGEDAAVWTGPGTVSNCGATTTSGTGCFLITNPFPPGVPVNLGFTVSQSADATSDFSIGKIEAGVYGVYGVRSSFKTWRAYLSDRDAKTVTALLPNSPAFTQLLVDGDILSTAPEKPDGLTVAPGISIDLDPAGPCGVPIVDGVGGCVLVAGAQGATAAKFGNVKLKEGPSGARLFQVTGVPDCRYVPIACFNVLGLGASTPSADGAVDALINIGVIVPLDPSGPNRRNPAAQLLNVTPLLPEDVTSQFDSSGVAPGGLPPLYVSRQYRGQKLRDFRIDALFFKTETGVVFLDTYQGEIDVSKLSGFELGCNVPATSNVTTSVLRKWDAITTVSETYKGVGGRYIDTITNVGCRNPTKISGGRTSLFPILEVAPDTYGPTIRSFSPRVTTDNDAVFARLVQSLWDDVGILRRDFACKQADTVPTGGVAPLPGAVCNTLAGIWSVAKFKLDLCVTAAFFPQNSTGTAVCNLARKYVIDYQNALPASATGPDVANRLGEQKARVETFLHVFDTRFRPSIKPTGYCREWTALSNPPYKNCPAL